MLPATSRVPDVLAALAAACRAALPGVTVTIGPPTATQMTDRTLVLGWPADGPSVTSDVARAEGMGSRYRERVVVSCVASVISGTTSDPEVLATQARDMVAAVETIAAVGIAGDRAVVSGRQQWFVGQGASGLAVDLLFDVVVESMR